ncbi:MAG: 16S rRNA (adenine(1518)-N(6)/adenine(1519)-N(6))-dimethyltransferase RsmA [Alphaproteobacteria bacterium]|nr:16S rRNA (adenine(1518)-N(6)/adenine(1519)-N(6))-dimethyltransferase RsmA [Alphaproteobacteria bacterium]
MNAPAQGDDLPPLRAVIAHHGLAARHSLGQHFLLDLNLTGRIARAAGDLTSGTTIEVGPGPGGLTRALLARGAQVVALERDERCLPALAEVAAAWPGKLDVRHVDATTVAAHEIGAPPRRIVANLPYNVATPLLIGWLHHAEAFESLTLMFQKEVADRIVAAPDTPDYGRLSVIAQWRCDAKRLFDIGPRAFTPPPKVVSTVVSLIPRPRPAAPARMPDLERVTAAAFGQRRKMLRQSLRSLGVDTTTLLSDAAIDPTRRAETLTIAEFAALARAFTSLRAGA